MPNQYAKLKLKIFSLKFQRTTCTGNCGRNWSPLGKCSVKRFSDGEVQINIEESIRGCDVFIVQSTSPCKRTFNGIINYD